MPGVMEMARHTTLALDSRLYKVVPQWVPGASPLGVNIVRSAITIHEWNGLTKKCKARASEDGDYRIRISKSWMLCS